MTTRNLTLLRATQIALGCCLAIFLAQLLSLQNAISAGVVTILSLLDTKKETLRSALDRLMTFALALAAAYVAFGLLGYGLPGFGAYLLAFSLCAYLLRLQASLPICTVLMSHFWAAGEMPLSLIVNETLLLCIGSGIGIALNLLFLPRSSKAIREGQARIEAALRAFFLHLSNALGHRMPSTQLESDLGAMQAALQAAQQQAVALSNNTLFADTAYYTQYVIMRRNQYEVLRRIASAYDGLQALPPPAARMADYAWEVAQSIHEDNRATALLASLHEMRDAFRTAPLPQTREEFEARAILFGILMDMEHFLMLKKTFMDEQFPQETEISR